MRSPRTERECNGSSKTVSDDEEINDMKMKNRKSGKKAGAENTVEAGKSREAGIQDRYIHANTAYYKEILSYVQAGRDILNACPPGVRLPPLGLMYSFLYD